MLKKTIFLIFIGLFAVLLLSFYMIFFKDSDVNNKYIFGSIKEISEDGLSLEFADFNLFSESKEVSKEVRNFIINSNTTIFEFSKNLKDTSDFKNELETYEKEVTENPNGVFVPPSPFTRENVNINSLIQGDNLGVYYVEKKGVAIATEIVVKNNTSKKQEPLSGIIDKKEGIVTEIDISANKLAILNNLLGPSSEKISVDLSNLSSVVVKLKKTSEVFSSENDKYLRGESENPPSWYSERTGVLSEIKVGARVSVYGEEGNPKGDFKGEIIEIIVN